MAFKPITLNTPAEEPAHILAEDDAAIYESIIGGDCVLPIGGLMKATVLTNNKVRITDGAVVVGGHVGRIVKGDYEDMTIANGQTGQNRNDIIAARFLAGADGGSDSYSLVVIQGTPGSAASDPVIVKGDLYAGDKQRDYPLWRVCLEGLSITKVEQMHEISTANMELADELDKLSNTVSGNASKITSLQTTVSGNASKITSLQTTVSGNTSKITSLQTTVSGNTSKITSLQTSVNGKEPTQKRTSLNAHFYKAGYACFLHCNGDAANTIITTLPAAYRPVSTVVASGFCYNISAKGFYPCIAQLAPDGTWDYVSAITEFGGAAYYIYNASSGINRRSNFQLWLAGSWLTTTNGA